MQSIDKDEPAILLEDVSKLYRHYERPLDRLRELFVKRPLYIERRSVSNVSMTIGRGEVVGIIGRNGAGKSTLLKMIAGRLEPTLGRVSVNGAIAAILELGTGFHPDLTGRENVKVGGLCLGLTKRQIEQELQNIIDFSELNEFIDMPFRTYSSGMQARLTFATAVTVDPDILIIDEALSVGDNKFQLKSFNRIRQFQDAGKTILLVTHSMSSITSFCDRAILLDRGRVLADGDPKWVTSVYHHLQFGVLTDDMLTSPDRTKTAPAPAAVNDPINDKSGQVADVRKATGNDRSSSAPVDTGSPNLERDDKTFVLATFDVSPLLSDQPVSSGAATGDYRYGDKRVTILGVAIFDGHGGGPIRQLTIGHEYQLVMDCRAEDDLETMYCGFLIRDLKGDILFGSDTTLGEIAHNECLTGVRRGECRRIISKIRIWLAAGDYFVSGAATAEVGKQSDMWFDAFEFRVVGEPDQHTNSRVYLEPRFSVIPYGTRAVIAQDRSDHD
jgi:lipopolysaccharide transport system ATP-binding protein